MMKKSLINAVALLLAAKPVRSELAVDVEDSGSIKKAASAVAKDLMSFYTGDQPGQIPGLLDEDEYWWTGGAFWGTLLQYRNATGDTSYDSQISQGLAFQKGERSDYMPANHTMDEGNDDQAYWAIAALLADENALSSESHTDWLDLARTVYDEQTARLLNTSSSKCDNLLRWQIYTFNSGYSYIATTANALYLNLGTQLARITGNETYTQQSKKVWEALGKAGLVDEISRVYDGAQVAGCGGSKGSINKIQISSSAALLLEGAANMYNATGDATWKSNVDDLANRTLTVFFPDGVMVEVSCEARERCTNDMVFQKGLALRSLYRAGQAAPWIAAAINDKLKTTAKAAIKTCDKGDNGQLCGYSWNGGNNSVTGVAQQMNALSALTSLLQPVAGEGTRGSTGSGNSTTGDAEKSMAAGLGVQCSISFVVVLVWLGIWLRS